MENLNDRLIEVEYAGRREAIFGTLDPQRLDESGGKLRYNGNLKLLPSYYQVSWSVYHPDPVKYSGLQGALVEAKKGNSLVKGIIFKFGRLDGVIEGFEFGSSDWQPYLEE